MGPNDQLKSVATALVEGCRTGKEQENIDKLYAENAVSVEAYASPDMDMDREAKGRDAIKGKHDWWNANFEMLTDGMSPEEMVQGPFYFGDDQFSVHFKMKTKNKQTGDVQTGEETATYHVKDGKIVREEFFYAM